MSSTAPTRTRTRHIVYGWLAQLMLSVTLMCTVDCNDDNSAREADSGDETGGGADSGQKDATPVPGVSAAGWKNAFTEKGAGASCNPGADDLAAMPQVTVGETTLYVGFQQVSADNQDPIFLRYDSGKKVYCVYHETQAPDGRALGLTWDGGDHAYVVYSIVGGGSELEGKGGWLSSYAPGAISGGGPKVSVVGRVNAKDGILNSSTFVIAVNSKNKVNSHKATAAITMLADGIVEFVGDSRYNPIDISGKDRMDCGDAPFITRYRLSADLGQAICADSTHCVSQKPCVD